MRWLMLVAMLFASSVMADVPTDTEDLFDCRDKTAGAGCKTDDGVDGTCIEVTGSRNDYSSGIPPKRVHFKQLRCDPAKGKVTAKVADRRSTLVPLLGGVLLGLLLLTRRRFGSKKEGAKA